MKLFNSEPVSIDEVKDDLNQAATMEFVALLEKHHDYLEESIKIIQSKTADSAEKQVQLGRFLHLVNMHAKAEEETLYVGLKAADEKLAHLEGIAAQDEHDIAYQLADELREMGFDLKWNEEIEAKAMVLAGLVQNHINEEEAEIFKTAKESISEFDFEDLRDEYIQKCRIYLDEELDTNPFRNAPLVGDRPSAAI